MVILKLPMKSVADLKSSAHLKTNVDLKSSASFKLVADLKSSADLKSRAGGWDIQGQSESTSDKAAPCTQKLHSEFTTSMILYSIYMYVRIMHRTSNLYSGTSSFPQSSA